MQEHSPELKYTGCPKSNQTHRHLKTHYWTLHCTHQKTLDSREQELIQKPPYLHWNQAPPKSLQVPEQDIPHQFSSNTRTQPQELKYRLPKAMPNPQTPKNSLLDTSLHSREKRSSSTHQNTDQASLTRKPWQVTNPTPPTGSRLHN